MRIAKYGPPAKRQKETARAVSHAPRRATLLAIAKAHGASRVRLFGSYARGTPRSRSDIDLLVRMDAGKTLLDLVALGQELESALGRKVDLLTEEGLSPHLRPRILQEARPL